MESPDKVLYFKSKSKNKDSAYKDLELTFEYQGYKFYVLKQSSLLDVTNIEDEDINLKTELKKAEAKMEKISAKLIDEDFKLISSADYKKSEKTLKEEQLNSFTNKFSEDEKIIYQKTKDFLEEYDIYQPAQKQFVVSLRPAILNGEEIDENYLDEYGRKNKKDVNKIFDSGVQGLICDFISNLQKEINAHKKERKPKL